ncbi:NlpC/P60 family protein [Klebsiella aerogenes]|uniref:NlpC/P60 family protein n=1 Tax=Klebsiella aerogenes TaxID=548 RepID=UPI00379B8EA6
MKLLIAGSSLLLITLLASVSGHAGGIKKTQTYSSHTDIPLHLKVLTRRAKLLEVYQHWKGTRYQYGGNSHYAIDCSALTKRIYKSAFHLDLPRTSTEQLRKGVKIKKQNLRTGDLVFFRTAPGQRHVGVYIGRNQFIHASRRKGVTISTLANPYWKHRFIAGRQILQGHH